MAPPWQADADRLPVVRASKEATASGGSAALKHRPSPDAPRTRSAPRAWLRQRRQQRQYGRNNKDVTRIVETLNNSMGKFLHAFQYALRPGCRCTYRAFAKPATLLTTPVRTAG